MHTSGINTGIPFNQVNINKNSPKQVKDKPVNLPSDQVTIGDRKQAGSTEVVVPSKNKVFFSELNSVITDLDDCSQIIKTTENSMYRADNNIQDASRSLNSSGYPISEASQDTAQTDVSQQGYHISSHIVSARGDIDSGQGKADMAIGDLGSLKNKLALSFTRVKKVADQMTNSEHQTVKKLLISSIYSINETFKSCSNGQMEIKDVNREILDAHNSLTFSDMYIWDIKSDHPGKDVSNAGRQLNSLVNRTQWGLRETERHIRGAEIDMNKAGQSVKKAISSLHDATVLLKDTP